MKVSVVRVRIGVPVPPIVGWLAACAIAKNENSSRITTDIERILREFARILRFSIDKFKGNLFFLLSVFIFLYFMKQAA